MSSDEARRIAAKTKAAASMQGRRGDMELVYGVAVNGHSPAREAVVNGLIYLIGLIVVIMFILSFLGLH